MFIYIYIYHICVCVYSTRSYAVVYISPCIHTTV